MDTIKQNTIQLRATNGLGDAVLFPVSDDTFVAWSLWLFFIEHLRPGFTVELSIDGTNSTFAIDHISGDFLPSAVRKKLMKEIGI